MKRSSTVIFCFVILFYLMVVFNSCINENKIFDRETMPSKNEFKFFVTNVLKGLSAEPSSVDVDFVGVILWHKDYGWVAQCNFSWVNMRGQRERQFLHFAIKGNAQYGVKILTEDQVEVIKHLPMNMIKNEYEVN